jgi:outer membrane protein OmpA-like peptidoglycan-associated protein
MKKSSLWLLCLSLIYILHSNVCAQTSSKELSPGYYVVVGAYAESKEESAKRFVETLSKRGHKANYGFNASRNLYFVYLKYFTKLKASLRNMEATRASGKFVDAWVRVVPGDIKSNTTPTPAPVIMPQPVTTESDSIAQIVKPQDTTQSVTTTPVIEVTDNEEIKQYDKMTLGNTEVFLSLYNARNNRIVDGEVAVVDTERSRQVMKVKGNEYLLLPDPKSKSGQLTLICEAFGYRRIQHELNYPIPLADTVKPHIDLVGTTIIVNFDLIRYRLGDIVTMYNVYFYNDAAIMLPESQYELNSLLQMMKENENYRIRLHGHTNGNYHGKIISMGPEKKFFELTGAKENVGTSKELSLQRASVIKEYLVANGIDAMRIETKAWGGKRPLYDRKSVNAKKNVRVEVEVLAE